MAVVSELAASNVLSLGSIITFPVVHGCTLARTSTVPGPPHVAHTSYLI